MSKYKTSKYKQSEDWLERAEKVIPLGSQTFSKSRYHFPYGVSPFFAERAQGATLWDIDGNQYLDFLSGLLSISLGYCDPDVDQAVKQQMTQGVIFSLPHRLEAELAELLVEMIPCAESVRYGKNGSDVTTAAIRLARACTGRDHIAVCGYHGWQDWYIGSTTRDLGVPEPVKQLTHCFEYNDLDSLSQLFDQYPQQIAAVIMEPMTLDFPQPGYLEAVKQLTARQGALLIFDEIITGFRFDLGGAQAYFGVEPDMATVGKGMANGYPLAALVGRKDVMGMMSEIFFSGTFGGETLSLAAAIATMKKMQKLSVTDHLARQGETIIKGVNQIIKQTGGESILRIKGHPAWSLLQFQDGPQATALELKTLFMQEMLDRGILMQSGHHLTLSHGAEEVEQLLSVYREVLPLLIQAVKENQVQALMRSEALKPLFQVRR